MKTLCTTFVAAATIVVAFIFGEAYGRHEVMRNTVVQFDSPRFFNRTFFGECARIGHNIEACATMRGDQ